MQFNALVCENSHDADLCLQLRQLVLHSLYFYLRTACSPMLAHVVLRDVEHGLAHRCAVDTEEKSFLRTELWVDIKVINPDITNKVNL